MRKFFTALALTASLPLGAVAVQPAAAQSRLAEQRFRIAQQNFDRALRQYQDERARYEASGGRTGAAQYDRYGNPQAASGYDQYGRPVSGYNGQYNNGQYNNGQYSNGQYSNGQYNDPRYADRNENYDASRDYRDDPRYQERVLANNDRVYRGSDGRYYCKRADGTTGLIIGGAGGAILGNVIDGGHSRIVGTLLGGALGAIAGRAVDRSQTPSEIRCR